MRKARFIYLVVAASLFAIFAAAAGPLGLSDGGHPQVPLPGIHV
jgi:hypothetical protein